MSVLQVPKKAADLHRADVIAALHKKGWSMRALSLAHGLSPHTLKTALNTPYPKAERIIAEAIGCLPEEIWPERYAKRNFTPVLSTLSRKAASKCTESVSETTAMAAA